MWTPQQQHQQQLRKQRKLYSAAEQLQSIQSKLAWLQKLTMAEADDGDADDSSLSSDHHHQHHHNFYKKCTSKKEEKQDTSSEELKKKLELVSQLALFQELLIAHIERWQQCSEHLERLHSLKRSIKRGNLRLHFNAILLDGLQKDATLQERLHRQMEDFKLKTINFEKSK